MGHRRTTDMSVQRPEMVDAYCIVLQDGTMRFATSYEHAISVKNSWWTELTHEQREEHSLGVTQGGVLRVKFLKKDWDKMGFSFDAEGNS